MTPSDVYATKDTWYYLEFGLSSTDPQSAVEALILACQIAGFFSPNTHYDPESQRLSDGLRVATLQYVATTPDLEDYLRRTFTFFHEKSFIVRKRKAMAGHAIECRVNETFGGGRVVWFKWWAREKELYTGDSHDQRND